MSTQLIAGPMGDLEIAFDLPVGTVHALALVAHPHPLHGGTMDNKVTTTVARSCAAQGCAVVRLNYRGVGRSAGQFDHCVGEVDDAASALAHLQALHGTGLPIVLCGFSFGTAVVAQLAQRLTSIKQTQQTSPANAHPQLLGMVLAGAAVQRFAPVAVDVNTTLVVHGEHDETVPLAETLAWARPLNLPVTIVPNCDHFFNRQLVPLKVLVNRHLTALMCDLHRAARS